MGSNVDKYLEVNEHAAIDHTGLPGIGISGSTIIVGAKVIETDANFVTGPLSTKIIPANTLVDDDEVVSVKFHASSGSGAGPTLTIAFDSNTILIHAFGSSGEEAQVHIWLVKTGATTCRASAAITDSGGGTNAGSATFTLDWALARDITFSFAGGTNVNHRFYQSLKWPKAGALGLSGIGSDTLPVGCIVPYGGTIASVPAGFLPCDGTAVSRLGEEDLFAIIGETWGAGDTVTTFNVPDLRGKSVLGLNDGTLPAGADGGFTTRVLAADGGEEAHQITLGEMPAHTHDVATAGSSAGTTISANRALTPGINTTSSIGGDVAHNTMHPFTVCAYIIKSQQIGGGIGVTAQNNGGTLTGTQPILNFIPAGIVGLSVAEDVGNTRQNITITGTETFDAAIHDAAVHVPTTHDVEIMLLNMHIIGPGSLTSPYDIYTNLVNGTMKFSDGTFVTSVLRCRFYMAQSPMDDQVEGGENERAQLTSSGILSWSYGGAFDNVYLGVTVYAKKATWQNPAPPTIGNPAA